MTETVIAGMDLAQPGSDKTVVMLARKCGKRIIVLSPEMAGFAGRFAPDGSTFISPMAFYAEPPPEVTTVAEPPRNRKERRQQAAEQRRRS
ncbi:MAG: hypothetical protein HQL97_00340 [Magnetococcales bacterium]|nr:hypothetical protein [Magnetococcales bacterium]